MSSGSESAIPWAIYKPIINETTLETTQGPSGHSEREPSCIICLEECKQDDITMTHSTCSHTAHDTCLKQWLDRQSELHIIKVCPMCRQAYSPGSVIDAHCAEQSSSAEVELANSFEESYIMDEEIIDVLKQAYDFLNSSQTDHVCELPDPYVFCREVDSGYWEAINDIECKALNILETRMRRIKGEAEDAMVEGKAWNEVKTVIDQKWQAVKLELHDNLKDFKNDAASRKADILRTIRRYAFLTAHMPSPLRREEHTEFIAEMDHFTQIFPSVHLPRVNKYFEIAVNMLTIQRQREQLAYHARTGRWEPENWEEDAINDEREQGPISRWFDAREF